MCQHTRTVHEGIGPAGGFSGGRGGRWDEEEEGEEEEEDAGPFKGWDEGSGLLRSAQQEADAREGRAADEEFGDVEGPVKVRLDSEQLVARHGLLEDEDGFGSMGGRRGGGGGGGRAAAAAAQREAAGEVEGSLWWHRNFAASGDEALVKAQLEMVE